MYSTLGTVIPPYAAAEMLKVREQCVLFIRERLPRIVFPVGKKLTSRYSWLYIDKYRKFRMSKASTIASNVRLENEVNIFGLTDIAKEAAKDFTQGFQLALEHNSKGGYLDMLSLARMLEITPTTIRNWLHSEQAKPYVDLNPHKFRITPENFLKVCPILLPS